MKVCPKCGKEYNERPAKSRIDNSDICSSCGSLEALEATVNAGAMSREVAMEIFETLKNVNRK